MDIIEKNIEKGYNDSYILKEYYSQYSSRSLSRYKRIDKILLANNKVIRSVLNPWDIVAFPVNEEMGSYLVRAEDENRLDIIAYKLYGSASLYWILCYANEGILRDPLKVPIGTILAVPNLTDMFQYPNVLG